MTVQTTTSGSLPRTQALIDAHGARTFEDDGFTLRPTPEVDALTARAVADVVARQRDVGITLVGDGEFGKAMTGAVDYGAWWSYSFQRVESAVKVAGFGGGVDAPHLLVQVPVVAHLVTGVDDLTHGVRIALRGESRDEKRGVNPVALEQPEQPGDRDARSVRLVAHQRHALCRSGIVREHARFRVDVEGEGGGRAIAVGPHEIVTARVGGGCHSETP